MAEGTSSGEVGHGQAVEQAVELVYRPTLDDVNQALRARLKRSLGWRFAWVLGIFCYVIFGLLMLLMLVTGRGLGEMPHAVWVAMIVLPLTLWGTPWLQARAVAKHAEQQGEFRVSVDDTGIRITNESSSARYEWQGWGRYAETDGVFVLLSRDKAGVGMMALPKRGVTGPGDADQLRAFLDRHLTRM
ncbi:YcxB family protein [Streptomyces sp. NPDC000410]|uniref:YcxB family protein n=1 Tax=Streptomyces sp. NPDC000410 TaxID=3154254 RepID=UPI0033284F44